MSIWCFSKKILTDTALKVTFLLFHIGFAGHFNLEVTYQESRPHSDSDSFKLSLNYFPITPFLFALYCSCRTSSEPLILPVSRGDQWCRPLVAPLDSWRELYVNHLTYCLPSHPLHAEHISAIPMQWAEDLSRSRLERVRFLFFFLKSSGSITEWNAYWYERYMLGDLTDNACLWRCEGVGVVGGEARLKELNCLNCLC